MERTIKVVKTYNLRFKLGVFSHIKSITGIDGLTFIQTAGTDIVHGCFALILAAAKCYIDKHGGSVDEAELKRDIENEGDLTLLTDITNMYAEFVNPNGVAKEVETANPQPSQRFKNSPSDSLV